MDLENLFLECVSSAVGKKKQSLHAPFFIGKEEKYLSECISSTFVSSVGKFVDKFEEKIREYTGSKYAICVVNGTSASS